MVYKEILPLKNDLYHLFISTGWNEEYRLSGERIYKALGNNWFCISAFYNNELVGFGRVVSDGVLHAMIYDLITLPEFQKSGIGSTILKTLVQKCVQCNIPDIQLFCASGKRMFYEKRGFVARSEDGPGMQYQIKTNQNK
ncbi:MAG: hypothetical protein A2W99_14420 [Bacteroidetes bacterium GWF2_33_16]|nr:MAG: hypothetical protein A2X00_08630 [Bacteroidetes bacterium GWE2_32_14]OFY04937.1 MAG: hypothetical protein A2W99_14420 [Bacteroidetes bacterium GWF2_33_16]